MSDTPKKLIYRSSLLAAAIAASLYGTQAWSQEESETEEEAQETSEEVTDRVTVTGSLLRRDEFTSSAPIQVITADTQVQLGQVDTAEFLQGSSIAAGSTQLNNQFSGFVVEGGTGVNSLSLRGLGAQRTLVLLNNRRPGPAGTRGQVGAFDLNVIPSSIVQRAEILKDGASSIYGSDAVAGVVNVITRRSVDRPELTVSTSMPFESGGETYSISGAYGWNFDRGSVVVAGEWQLREELMTADRDFLSCPQDLFTDRLGNSIDREDRSILAGTSLSGCNNLYANTVIDALFGDRYIPAPDGVTIGLIPGYRPRANGRYDDPGGVAFYEDVLNFDFYSESAINRQERTSIYASSDVSLDLFGGTQWNTEWLFNRRETEATGWRQFFPLTGGATSLIPSFSYANNPDFVTPVPSGLAQPVIPYPSNGSVQVDYIYVATGLEGDLPFGDNWAWAFDMSYTYSDGDYSRNSIVASRSGDVRFSDDAPVLDYFSPGILSGADMDQLVAAIGATNKGNTVYDQFVATAVATGDLLELPAGTVGLAVGAEYRSFSIDDQPSELSINGDLWGESSALVTKGDDSVSEIFAEVEVPLLAGLPFAEFITLNGSVRAFDYDSAGSDSVWKVGLNWQVNPSLRLRATEGTSYRAPGLFELFLGDQTAFVGQTAIDPCIDWGESTNDNLRANCAADGLPADWAGGPSSATIISGGGAGVLESETSEARTAGFIFTPTFMDVSIAVDYFEIEVNDQIGQLGGAAILFGCYTADNFPNAFCDLFDRNPDDGSTSALQIDTVRDSYININQQSTKGVDMTVRYDRGFTFGDLLFEANGTWVFEDIVELFDPSLESGFDTNDQNATIGRPKFVANGRFAFERGDWTYTWGLDYVRRTSEERFIDAETTYFGFPTAVRDIVAEDRLYHSISVFYEQPKWSVLVGISNLLDDEPPVVSSGAATRRGNIPINATQYDLRGRTAFARLNYRF
ncbi:MAG: TonB-dependent receptor [Wenzhouxiangella sp.]|jgi:iron complex outermembrane receptor protein|nr:TonB-dependent receptor [Wenzhouxiangella sp.]